MAETEKAEDIVIQKLSDFFRWINQTDLLCVIAGGALGGFLMPLVRKFLKSEAPFNEAISTPQSYDAWFLGALLGTISAGVVVYSLSYSDNNNRRQVFFISLLAGLTFPGFLSGALDIEKADQLQATLAETKDDIADGIKRADSDAEKEKIAEDTTEIMTEAMEEVKANALDIKDREIAVDDTTSSIEKLAATAIDANGKLNVSIAENVEDIAATAQKQGYYSEEGASVAEGVIRKLEAQRKLEAAKKKRQINESIKQDEAATKTILEEN